MDLVKNKKEIKRIKTHISGLDENLEGGIPAGHIILVNGTSGTMKSSVSFNILYNEAIKGSTSFYLTLEQSSASIIKHMVNMDFDMSKINLVIISDISKIEKDINSIKYSKKGNLIMVDLGAIRKKVKDTRFSSSSDWLNAIKNLTTKIAHNTKCELFVLDSMSALYALSKFEDPRTKLFYIFEFLRDLGLTSFLISESPVDKNKFTEFGAEEYLADGILHLKLTERYRRVTREISIVKMRATKCNLDIFTLEYEKKRFSALYGGKTPVV
jgi:KaiC/GvpD/RAD55 family RecA-like ATPase